MMQQSPRRTTVKIHRPGRLCRMRRRKTLLGEWALLIQVCTLSPWQIAQTSLRCNFVVISFCPDHLRHSLFDTQWLWQVTTEDAFEFAVMKMTRTWRL